MADAGEVRSDKLCGCIRDADHDKATSILRWANMGNAALVIFAGIYSLVTLGDIITFQIAALSVSLYLTCFGLLLCCFELRLTSVEKTVRRRFGFMFSFMGRTLFLFFVGTLCFARNTTTTIVIGVVTILNGLMNAWVMYKYDEAFKDPTGRYAADNNAFTQQAIGAGAAYAASNPQLMQQGVQAGASYARNNPDQAARLAQQAALQRT